MSSRADERIKRSVLFAFVAVSTPHSVFLSNRLLSISGANRRLSIYIDSFAAFILCKRNFFHSISFWDVFRLDS